MRSSQVHGTQGVEADGRGDETSGANVHAADVHHANTIVQDNCNARTTRTAISATATGGLETNENKPAKPNRPPQGTLLAGRKRRPQERPPEPEFAARVAVAGQQPVTRTYWAVAGVLTAALTWWLFGSTLRSLVQVWNTEPDYSHGYLMAPIAALMLWLRRELKPAATAGTNWGGPALLTAGFAMRFAGDRLFLTPLCGWGLVLWLAGACWLLAGWRTLAWALPALGFLLFMIPLPFRADQLIGRHLQTFTTELSAALFECLGQSAVAEGRTIFLGDHVLEIEQTCSGFSMLMGIGAIAFACVMLLGRSRRENLILIGAIAPVAMLSNAIRVVIAGLLLPSVSSETTATQLSHNGAGWTMFVVGLALFGLLIVYLRKLFIAVEIENWRQRLNRCGVV